MTSHSFLSHRELREAEINKTLKTGMHKAVAVVKRDAIMDCPYHTSRLRNSIDDRVEEDGMLGIVGTDVEYAGFVEMGTSKMPARPYLFPALEKNRKRIKELLKSG